MVMADLMVEMEYINMPDIITIIGLLFLVQFIGLLLLAVMWSWLYQILLDIKMELIESNQQQKKDRSWNYTMKELEAAIKHE